MTNQIDFVVISMDIPYRVTETNGLNGTYRRPLLRLQVR